MGVAMDGGDSLSLSYQESSLPQLEVVNEERGSDNVFEQSAVSAAVGHVSSLSLGEEKSPPIDIDTEENHRSNGEKQQTSKHCTHHHCHHLSSSSSSFLQRQLSTDELQLKRASPYYMAEEEEGPVCELWVASSNARHSTITVVDYAQQFTRLEVRHTPTL